MSVHCFSRNVAAESRIVDLAEWCFGWNLAEWWFGAQVKLWKCRQWQVWGGGSKKMLGQSADYDTVDKPVFIGFVSVSVFVKLNQIYSKSWDANQLIMLQAQSWWWWRWRCLTISWLSCRHNVDGDDDDDDTPGENVKMPLMTGVSRWVQENYKRAWPILVTVGDKWQIVTRHQRWRWKDTDVMWQNYDMQQVAKGEEGWQRMQKEWEERKY